MRLGGQEHGWFMCKYKQLDQVPTGFSQPVASTANEKIAETSSGDAALQARLDNLRREWAITFLFKIEIQMTRLLHRNPLLNPFLCCIYRAILQIRIAGSWLFALFLFPSCLVSLRRFGLIWGLLLCVNKICVCRCKHMLFTSHLWKCAVKIDFGYLWILFDKIVGLIVHFVCRNINGSRNMATLFTRIRKISTSLHLAFVYFSLCSLRHGHLR